MTTEMPVLLNPHSDEDQADQMNAGYQRPWSGLVSATSAYVLPPASPASVARKERRLTAIVLLLALIHGLIYVAMMPPWEHYEEPTHFEYAWLIASRGSLPQYPAYDQDKRRQIAMSMVKHGFFEKRPIVPNLDAVDEPIWIGVNVSGALPLYHILIAAPLRLLANADVDVQLYAARLVSLMLYVLTVWIACLVARELVPPGHVLRYAFPAVIALVPGFADLMTAVNNDVGATFVFTKSTVLVAAPLAVLAIGLALCRPRWRGLLWAVFLGALFCAAISLLSWGDASLWYRFSSQESATQASRTDAPVGTKVIALEAAPAAGGAAVKQPLLTEEVERIRGKTVTLGAWVWASAPVRLRLPALSFNDQPTAEWQETVGVNPSFYAGRWVVPSDVKRITVILRADPTPGQNGPVMVYYDGIVLLEGNWPGEAPPTFTDTQGVQVKWGGRGFINAIRNASAEDAWPWVRPWVQQLASRFPWSAHLSPTLLLASFLDLQHTGLNYSYTVWRLFTTFWGSFGWGGILLPGTWYNGLAVATALGVLGTALGAGRRYCTWALPWQNAIIWLALAGLALWGPVVLRGLFSTLDARAYFPTARYGYPAILPTILVVTAGWQMLLRRWPRLSVLLLAGGLVALDVASVVTILDFFGGA
jgi:hypothetical protein